MTAPSPKYRSQARILADILRAIYREGDAKPTRILYSANLSHDRLTKFLLQLKGMELIEEVSLNESERVYRLTEKGSTFLKEFKKVEEFAESFGLRL